ncbi:MAG: LysM peptidoglycan-binding domain-containing protein [Lachnospiraceae bacterium]|nr:LysM peptidoglycan-binding domain-containing protein [Lachnospiraceae bacterium]MDD7077527.1 LysM peptidoglycan-binding domain-containing protein [Lachnospiraceae bacterium]MDY3731126.1 LysM peptidoglycan-binding domain-containing protein [Candidatus Choladocola sp.]
MEKESALPKNIRQIGDVRDEEKVYIEDYVMTYIRKKEAKEEEGYLGIFLGEQKEEKGAMYVFIRGILELQFPGKEEKKEQRIDGESAEKQREEKKKEQKEKTSADTGVDTEESFQTKFLKEKDNYFPDWEIQGCCVIGTYQAKELEQLSEVMPEAGKLIYHLQEQEETLYLKEADKYKRMKGYFVFYEQNKKMQEYLSDVFRDEGIEKENLPDRAIKSFREKVKEKGEKRTGSMLKMASSFFVMTILIIGAITVTRLDEIRSIKNTAGSDAVTLEQADQAEDGAALQKTAVEAKIEEGVENTAEVEAGAEGMENTTGGEIGIEGMKNTAGVETGIEGTENTAGVETEIEGTGNTAGVETGIKAMDNNAGAEAKTDSVGNSAASETGTGGTENATVSEIGTGGTENATSSETVSRAIMASYVIKQGDTLADICNRYYGSTEKLEELCEANHIENANMIMPGQKIVLP